MKTPTISNEFDNTVTIAMDDYTRLVKKVQCLERHYPDLVVCAHCGAYNIPGLLCHECGQNPVK